MIGDDILKLAAELFARNASPSEALSRNIVGRAYYGAFHVAKAFLAKLGLTDAEISGRHGPVQDWLIDSEEPTAKRAGDLLRNLYAARRRADYELNQRRAVQESQDPEFIKDQVELAYTIKSLLDSCAVEPKRTEVLRSINNLRQRAEDGREQRAIDLDDPVD